ncbi:DVU_1555 family C-GCAxxG-C-C protein [Mailhella sp.]|uniref:DVU_1555 family C-GCAxxG-C-C protein n=1 Tax=Mailhella sp. TaxID=1981029 RepID=UPI003AB38162
MNALLLDLLPYVRQGYCCSQLMLALAKQLDDRENSGLMCAMRGLCHGLGQAGGPCGLLTGGAAILAWLSSDKEEEPHPMIDAMVHEYASWFMERTHDYGGVECERVAAGLASSAGTPLPEGGMPPMDLCGDLLAECWEKLLDIYESYDLANARS